MSGLIVRERTPRSVMLYAVYLYLLGLSYRGVEAAIGTLHSRRWTTVWYWVQRLGTLVRGLFACRGRVALVDEGQVQVGSEQWWFWLALEPHGRCILHLKLTAHRNSLASYRFLKELKARCGVRYVYTDGARFYLWACGQLRLRHRVAPMEVRNIIERCIEFVEGPHQGLRHLLPVSMLLEEPREELLRVVEALV